MSKYYTFVVHYIDELMITLCLGLWQIGENSKSRTRKIRSFDVIYILIALILLQYINYIVIVKYSCYVKHTHDD